MQIWDTAGQEKFRSMAPMYYRNSQGAVVMYSVDSAESFAGIEAWIAELRESVEERLVIAVVGNKCDLPERQVTYEEGKSFSDAHNCLFFETSAKDDTGVAELFQALCEEIVAQQPAAAALQPAAQAREPDTTNIFDNNRAPAAQRCGC